MRTTAYQVILCATMIRMFHRRKSNVCLLRSKLRNLKRMQSIRYITVICYYTIRLIGFKITVPIRGRDMFHPPTSEARRSTIFSEFPLPSITWVAIARTSSSSRRTRTLRVLFRGCDLLQFPPRPPSLLILRRRHGGVRFRSSTLYRSWRHPKTRSETPAPLRDRIQ